MSVLVKVVSLPDGRRCRHSGRYVVAWNPHTRFGVCDISTTSDRSIARRFKDHAEALAEWRTVSHVEAIRPDGRPNRPLTGLVIESENEAGGFPA